jgi:hypothetical protein
MNASSTRRAQPWILTRCAILAMAAATAVTGPVSAQPVARAIPADAAAPAAFEIPGAVETARFLPPDLTTGPLHHVATQAFNDGFDNTYFLRAGDAEYEVTGTLEIRRRIRELYAIAKLGEISKTGEFEKALGDAGKEKIESVVGVVRDPVGTIKRVPKGASRFFGRIGEGMKGGHAETEGNTVQAITGVWRAKVDLAVKLGVDPYSDNQELQQALLGVARASAGGGLLVNLGTAAVGGPVGGVLTGIGVNETLQSVLVNSSPDDLRIINRKKLFALGVDREAADAFLMHPWYSPVHETVICDALAAIGVDPSAFLSLAGAALTPEDALYFTRLARVLATRHAGGVPLRELRRDGGIVTALDRDGVLVVPVSLDYAIWSERVALRTAEFQKLPAMDDRIRGLSLWVDGQVSPRVTSELESRKIAVKTLVLGPR